MKHPTVFQLMSNKPWEKETTRAERVAKAAAWSKAKAAERTSLMGRLSRSLERLYLKWWKR